MQRERDTVLTQMAAVGLLRPIAALDILREVRRHLPGGSAASDRTTRLRNSDSSAEAEAGSLDSTVRFLTSLVASGDGDRGEYF